MKLFGALLALLALARAYAADSGNEPRPVVVLEYKIEHRDLSYSGEELRSSESTRTYQLHAGRILESGGRESLVLDREGAVFYLIDHELRETFRFDSPVRRKDLLAGFVAEGYRMMAEEWQIQLVESRRLGALDLPVGGACEQYQFRLRGGGGRVDETRRVCLSTAMGLDDSLFWRLMLDRSQVIPGREPLWERLAELGGIPIQWEIEDKRSQGKALTTITLESIHREPAQGSTFQPPAEYTISLPDPQGRFISRPLALP